MKHLAGVVLILLCFGVPDSFAQTEEEFRAHEEEARAYEDYLEKYYQDKAPEEIWRDYIDLRLNQDGILIFLTYRAATFKEPFKSWAISALLKTDLGIHELREFLGSDFPKESKDVAFKRFLDSKHLEYANTKISSPYLEGLVDLVSILPPIGDVPYGEYLIDHILNHPYVIYLSNFYLVQTLYHGSPKQKIKIANMIFNNNPGSWELEIIAGANIDIYSDMARNMLPSQNENIKDSWENFLFNWAKRDFLVKKMDR